MPNILVVDDEPLMRSMLKKALEKEGYQVLLADDGPSALDLFHQADVVVLDLSMPGMSGLEVLEIIRAEHPDLPVLFLTAHDQEQDRITGLRSGADDYLGKPLRVGEFLARIEVLLRRSKRNQKLLIGPYVLDPQEEQLFFEGKSVGLTPKEYRLLFTLARNPGSTISRGALFSTVWGLSADVDERVVDAYIARIRKKMGQPDWLETVFAKGYRLRAMGPSKG